MLSLLRLLIVFYTVESLPLLNSVVVEKLEFPNMEEVIKHAKSNCTLKKCENVFDKDSNLEVNPNIFQNKEEAEKWATENCANNLLEQCPELLFYSDDPSKQILLIHVVVTVTQDESGNAGASKSGDTGNGSGGTGGGQSTAAGKSGDAVSGSSGTSGGNSGFWGSPKLDWASWTGQSTADGSKNQGSAGSWWSLRPGIGSLGWTGQGVGQGIGMARPELGQGVGLGIGMARPKLGQGVGLGIGMARPELGQGVGLGIGMARPELTFYILSPLNYARKFWKRTNNAVHSLNDIDRLIFDNASGQYKIIQKDLQTKVDASVPFLSPVVAAANGIGSIVDSVNTRLVHGAHSAIAQFTDMHGNNLERLKPLLKQGSKSNKIH